MNEQQIILLVVMSAVVIIAIVFILRARKFCKEEEVIKTGSESGNLTIELESEDNSPKNSYLLKHICREDSSFGKSKTVVIRPRHLKLIREIIHVIGREELTIVSYVDNVLHNHFMDNKEIIESLYKDAKEQLFSHDE